MTINEQLEKLAECGADTVIFCSVYASSEPDVDFKVTIKHVGDGVTLEISERGAILADVLQVASEKYHHCIDDTIKELKAPQLEYHTDND